MVRCISDAVMVQLQMPLPGLDFVAKIPNPPMKTSSLTPGQNLLQWCLGLRQATQNIDDVSMPLT
jgi:hypothetical protein